MGQIETMSIHATQALYMEPTLSPKFAGYIEDYVVDLGGDPEWAFGANRQIYKACQKKDLPLRMSLVTDLFKQAQQYSGDRHIGIGVAKNYHYESAGIIVMLVLAAPNVKMAISALAQYDKYADLAINTDFVIGVKYSTFSVQIANPADIDVRSLNEFLVALFIDIMRKGTRQSVPIAEVWLQHDSGGDSRIVEQYFGSKVLFNQVVNRVVFESSFLSEKFRSANELLYKVLIDTMATYYMPQVNHGGFVAEVCMRIVSQSIIDSPSLELVAQDLAMSAKTLSRRLAKEGVNFQDVKRMAREQLAKFLLQETTNSLSEISFRLGYSELSAFSRAFRNWVGVTPHEFRDEVRKQ